MKSSNECNSGHLSLPQVTTFVVHTDLFGLLTQKLRETASRFITMDKVDKYRQQQLCCRARWSARQAGNLRETCKRLPRHRTHSLLLLAPTQETEDTRICHLEQVPRSRQQSSKKPTERRGGRYEEVHRDRDHGEVTIRVFKHAAEGCPCGVCLHRSVSLVVVAFSYGS